MTCPVCARRDPADGLTVCAVCLARIDDDLVAIVTLTRAAADHLTPATKPSAGGGSKPGSRPPLDLGALDDAMAARALPMLEEWERMYREHAHMAPYGPVSLYRARHGALTPDATLGGVVAFLRAQLARMVEDAEWPIEVMAAEIHEHRGLLARHDDDRPQRKPGIPLNCLADHPDADGRACDWRLWTDGRNVVTCPQCQTAYTPDGILDAHDMALLPAALLILLDHREPTAARKRIENLTARGGLTVHDYEPRPGGGRSIALYRLGEYRQTLDRHEETA